MPARKYVKPDEKVGLKLTAAERITILNDVEFLDDDYEQALQETPADQALEFTLCDWDYLPRRCPIVLGAQGRRGSRLCRL
jgi:hypothetical protein